MTLDLKARMPGLRHVTVSEALTAIAEFIGQPDDTGVDSWVDLVNREEALRAAAQDAKELTPVTLHDGTTLTPGRWYHVQLARWGVRDDPIQPSRERPWQFCRYIRNREGGYSGGLLFERWGKVGTKAGYRPPRGRVKADSLTEGRIFSVKEVDPSATLLANVAAYEQELVERERRKKERGW